MKCLISVTIALALAFSPVAFAGGPPYVFDGMSLVREESMPAGQRNICGYARKYSDGATYIVSIEAPTTDKACPKSIRWTERGRQVGSGTDCSYDMHNGTTAVAGYADSRSNSCWSESYVEWLS